MCIACAMYDYMYTAEKLRYDAVLKETMETCFLSLDYNQEK